MCAVSMVNEYYQNMPKPLTQKERKELDKLLKAAESFDKETNQPNCGEKTLHAILEEKFY